MGYNKESLENNILKCRENIKTFEDAIDKERAMIRELQGYIDTLDEKERQKKIMEQHVEIDREDGG